MTTLGDARKPWRTLVALAAMLVPLLTSTLHAQTKADSAPAAAWSFNGRLVGLARDTGADAHHASLRSSGEHTSAPGGFALALTGPGSYAVVKNHPDLVMTSSVTVDIWVKLAQLGGTEPQCLVDKRGERYRLQVNPSGSVLFGLKNDQGRFDLTGGGVEAGQWHRITGVFERPVARLYIDGEKVAEGRWDEEIGRGGDLFLGSKSGVTYFAKCEIDELRIFRNARPPKPGDQPVVGLPGAPEGEADMTVEHRPDGSVTIDTGAAAFELTQAGGIASIAVADVPVVRGNTLPLLSATALESDDYNECNDLVAGQLVEAAYQHESHEFTEAEDSFEGTFKGRLDFGDGDALLTETLLHAEAGSPFLSTSLRVEPSGGFTNRFLRSVAVRLPLALNKRKRVVQGGDRGIRWNTRHWYQFTVSTTSQLLEEPDHNIWRNFVIDQNTDLDYHIWRSESDATSLLSMQRGISAPGWIAAYDERAGLLVGYRDFAQRAPKTLWVQADGPGEAVAYLWSPTQPALDIHSPRAAAVFGEPHTVDWLPFGDDFRFAQPDLALRRWWGMERLASDPPPETDPPAQDVELRQLPDADETAPMVAGGVPFPRGALTDPANVRLLQGDTDVPLQTKPLAYWPDKSIKWLLLVFPADGGTVTGAQRGDKALNFELTRRVGHARTYRLEYGGGAKPGQPQTPLSAAESDGTVRINTGPLELELSAGANWLRSVKLLGREMLAGGVTSHVDFLRPDALYPCGRTHTGGVQDDGVFEAESIELEESGPMRAVVRLEGMTGSQEPQRVIIRLEAYAGRACARVFQTVEFLHKDPRVAFVRRMGMELPLAGEWSKTTIGGERGPVTAKGERAGLRQHSHLGYTAWEQTTGERHRRVVDSRNRSHGWLDLSGPQGGVMVAIRDMWQQAPNELAADRARGIVTVGLWPESVPPMDVRRYSNYPHRSQGESAGTPSSWVNDTWYPNDCFVGVSKTHEMLLHFHDADVDPAGLDSLAADFHRPPLVYAGRQWYHDVGVVLPQALATNPALERSEANLQHFAQFWLHHQKLWGWYGMWDYGDVGHYFKGGYGSLFPVDSLRALLAGGEEAEAVNMARVRFGDYRPNHDWAFDNGRWGWANTEGLLNLFMQAQYLRTGDRDLYFFVEAMARHVRDVDMRHDGKWFGYGTRHGVQHWSDGNHEERQTTHSEFRYHHYLSGDMRSRDFARQLYEGIYRRKDVRIHAAHSGRLQGLLTQWEMTGEDEVGDILARYVPAFSVPEGLVESPRVEFPEVERTEATGSINSGNMFFWTFGAGHGVIDQALIKTADDALADGRIGLRLKAVVFAAHHADDPEPYREALKDWVLGGGRRSVLQVVPHNPLFYAGPRGMLRGSTAGALFTMNDLPYVLTAIDADPPVDDETRRIDAEGGAYYDEPLLSWQSEYDLPEFEEYLRIKHPQP